MTTDEAADAQRTRRWGSPLALLALALATLTAVVATLPFVVPALYSDRLDISIVTAAHPRRGSVAALDWARAACR